MPAAQYFGTKGIFKDYDALLDEPFENKTRGEIVREMFERLKKP
jgi:Zn-dependent M32 family carboxypeptidase